MEYSCNVWAGAPNCYMDMLDKLQKWVCRTIVPAFTVSLEPVAHYRNGVSRTIIYRYFGRCSSELAKLVVHLYYHGKATPDTDRQHLFYHHSRCYKDVHVKSFFPPRLDLWNTDGILRQLNALC